MPIRDTAVMDAFLDLTLESQTWELALFDGDPMLDGVELAGAGYARVSIAPADWAPASSGEKSTVAPAVFPAATGAWDEATHFALFDPSGNCGDCCPLTEPLEVTGAGDGPSVAVTVFYDESVEAPA